MISARSPLARSALLGFALVLSAALALAFAFSCAGSANPVAGNAATAGNAKAAGYAVAAAPGAPRVAAAPAADATSAASAEPSWSIALSGLRSDVLASSFYQKLLADPSIGAERKAQLKGATHAYKGVPLRFIIAMIDGADSSEPFSFDETLWNQGYEVSLVGSDGYAATFSTKDLGPDALILALYEDGKPVPPMVVGDGPKSLWVKGLASIETSLAPEKAPAAEASGGFSIDLEVNGSDSSYSLKELEASDLWLEGEGGYTTSAGTRYSGTYGGVQLRGLIERSAKLRPEDTVRFVAMDGYEMSYPGASILDESDGQWILAWKQDGEYMPKDPGYVRTIKVGPSGPNIDGHLSVRMVKKIIVEQAAYKDFSLKLEGKASWSLDRATLQSCVSCHKRTVAFERKGQAAAYTGFPAYLLLGYVDDPLYAPHKQDKSIPAYDSALAKKGYTVDFVAADGFKVSLDSRDLDRNQDVIVAMYKNDAELGEDEFPLVLAWDKDAKLLPGGIKNAKMLTLVKAGL
jgi:hypothetical protein